MQPDSIMWAVLLAAAFGGYAAGQLIEHRRKSEQICLETERRMVRRMSVLMDTVIATTLPDRESMSSDKSDPLGQLNRDDWLMAVRRQWSEMDREAR